MCNIYRQNYIFIYYLTPVELLIKYDRIMIQKLQFIAENKCFIDKNNNKLNYLLFIFKYLNLI